MWELQGFWPSFKRFKHLDAGFRVAVADQFVRSKSGAPLPAERKAHYAELLKRQALARKQAYESVHRGRVCRGLLAIAAGLCALALTTYAAGYWLNLHRWSAWWWAMLIAEVVLIAAAISAVRFSKLHRVWFPAFSEDGRLLATGVVCVLVGVLAASLTAADGVNAPAQAAQPQAPVQVSLRAGATPLTLIECLAPFSAAAPGQPVAVSPAVLARTPSCALHETVRAHGSAGAPPQGRHLPGHVSRVALGGAFSLLALVFGFLIWLGLDILWQLGAVPEDPYPSLLVGMLEASGRLAEALKKAEDEPSEWNEARRKAAKPLERAARALATGAEFTPRLGAELNRDVISALREHGGRVAAWLRELQAQILWGPRSDVRKAQRKLARGLLNACEGNWQAIERKPRDIAPATWTSKALAFLPRVLLAALLAGAALLVPHLFPANPAAQAPLQVTLLGIAITALVTPGKALSDAATSVSDALRPTSK
jgi:hypothetical protein